MTENKRLPNTRQEFWRSARGTSFDVAILGGGINGACLYHHLCSHGYKVLLVDQGDFASGTSQASGMMIWGGLLYLRNLDLFSVYRFSAARDSMIQSLPTLIEPRPIHYVPSIMGRPNPRLVLAGLYFYWLLGHFQRRQPGWETTGMADHFLHVRPGADSLRYEEGVLKTSDARFVLQWITSHQTTEQVPLNYCAVHGGGYDTSKKQWRLELRDTLGDESAEARALHIVNCAGVWADPLNARFGIETPVKHILSKGVYLGVPRPPEHKTTMVFEMGEHGDAITYSPWGPISLWGPTETRVENAATNRVATANDVRFLLNQAERNFKNAPQVSDIVSLRCGLRPLAVPKSFERNEYTLSISRRHRIVKDSDRPWISLYGGKITGCTVVAGEISKIIAQTISPAHASTSPPTTQASDIEYTRFPGLPEKIPSAQWCRDNEFCHSLDDYLRRRTNISQWITREGLGPNDENLPALEKIALTLCNGNHENAVQSVRRYQERVRNGFDSLLTQL